jgi:hypothetical protein
LSSAMNPSRETTAPMIVLPMNSSFRLRASDRSVRVSQYATERADVRGQQVGRPAGCGETGAGGPDLAPAA